MNLTEALDAHAAWKTKLRGAIAKREKLDAATICRDNACALGKWLHGEGKGSYGRHASFTDCVAKHASFHKEAGKVAEAINAGQYEDAERMLGAGTSYAQASSSVGVAIQRLRKDAGQA